MNKSLVTNLLALALIGIGYSTNVEALLTAGVFSFSGAITNWLAIHMLFEKVPFLYGSGVIPTRFEEFKSGIKSMVMEQFFKPENIERFFHSDSKSQPIDLKPAIDNLNFELLFEKMIEAVMASPMGAMLGMFGGAEALLPMKPAFIEKMRDGLVELARRDELQEGLKKALSQQIGGAQTHDKLEALVDGRLNELTPQMVKSIIQDMIAKHLGWLVVWGGVFGALLGLIHFYIVNHL